MTTAIAVLIITCPCALGLAVPMVQVMAARRLFEKGIMVKDGTAIERLAEIDSVVFDKTGTLTLGSPRLLAPELVARDALLVASAIADHSNHPYSHAIAAAGRAAQGQTAAFDSVVEHPGFGLEARRGEAVYRLGRADWAFAEAAAAAHAAGVVLSKDGRHVAHFRFEDRLRPDALEAVAELDRHHLSLMIVSGDADAPVEEMAAHFGVPGAARVLPAQKLDYVRSVTAAGRRVLMVGDGLNDAPALAACVDGAGNRRGCRPQCGGFRISAGKPARRSSGGADRARGGGARPPEHGDRHRLQFICSPAGGRGARDTARRGGRDVRVLDHRGRQCGAAARPDMEDLQRRRSCGIRELASRQRGRPMIDFVYLIPISLALGAAGLAAFMWSLRSGQYEDLDGAAERRQVRALAS